MFDYLDSSAVTLIVAVAISTTVYTGCLGKMVYNCLKEKYSTFGTRNPTANRPMVPHGMPLTESEYKRLMKNFENKTISTKDGHSKAKLLATRTTDPV